MQLISLSLQTDSNFEKNLNKILDTCNTAPENSIVLAPELCLSGYSIDDLKKTADFSKFAIEQLKIASAQKTISLTMIIEEHGKFFNRFFAFHNQEIIWTQNKVELFKLNNEDKFFEAGKSDEIKLFNLNGQKIGVLICFELRFIKLWEALKGADIILVPAMWGLPRKEHFEILTKALAITNQCFVLATNSSDADCAKSSAIITPFGIANQNDDLEVISQEINLSEITKMRRYLKTDVN